MAGTSVLRCFQASTGTYEARKGRRCRRQFERNCKAGCAAAWLAARPAMIAMDPNARESLRNSLPVVLPSLQPPGRPIVSVASCACSRAINVFRRGSGVCAARRDSFFLRVPKFLPEWAG